MSSETPSRTAVIRTSDRLNYLGCRRKWDWSSHLRGNLGAKQASDPLWMGSGVHFALEDYHGVRVYGTAARAFMAYVNAYRNTYPKAMPDDWRELAQLSMDMMDYYETWLVGRDPYETFIFNGVPQLEAGLKIPIPWEALERYSYPEQMKRIRERYDDVIYSITLDRVIIDDNALLWIVEYKTAKAIMSAFFATDPQVSAYVWAAGNVYQQEIAGVIYQQHRKELPNPARVLQNGDISAAQNQKTTHRLYRKGLIDKYGEVKKAPDANIKLLNQLAAEEGPDNDGFVVRNKIHRNSKTSASVAQHILMEALEMLDPNTNIYPSPDRMCPNYCTFFGPCVSRDDGSDWEYDLKQETQERPKEYDEWRVNLPDPAEFIENNPGV